MSEFNMLSEKQTMLHKALVHDYEEKIKVAKAEREIMGQYKEKRGAQIRDIMSRSNFDMAAIDQLRKDDVRESKEFLDRVRPSLANREATKNNHAQDRAKRSSIIVPGQQTMPVHSATLLASTGSSLENNPGEKGNPGYSPGIPARLGSKLLIRRQTIGDAVIFLATPLTAPILHSRTFFSRSSQILQGIGSRKPR